MELAVFLCCSPVDTTLIRDGGGFVVLQHCIGNFADADVAGIVLSTVMLLFIVSSSHWRRSSLSVLFFIFIYFFVCILCYTVSLRCYLPADFAVCFYNCLDFLIRFRGYSFICCGIESSRFNRCFADNSLLV